MQSEGQAKNQEKVLCGNPGPENVKKGGQEGQML